MGLGGAVRLTRRSDIPSQSKPFLLAYLQLLKSLSQEGSVHQGQEICREEREWDLNYSHQIFCFSKSCMWDPDNSGHLGLRLVTRTDATLIGRDIFRVLNTGSENVYVLSQMKMMMDSLG